MFKNKGLTIDKKEALSVIVLGSLVLALFLITRLVNLTILPIFADEAIYIRWSQIMRAEPTLRFLPLSDGKQPLHMWLMIPFLKLISDPLLAGRLFSSAAGFGSAIGVFLVSWRLYKNKLISFFSVFFYVICPFFVFSDRLAMTDSLLLMFSIWLALLAVILAKTPRLDMALISGMILSLALLTKSPAVISAILFPTAIILVSKYDSAKYPKIIYLLKITCCWVIIWGIGFAIYNFLLRLGPGYNMIGLRNSDYVFSVKEILSHPLDPAFPHLNDLVDWLPNLFTFPVLVLCLIGICAGITKYIRETIYLLGLFMTPLLFQVVFARVFTPRYILFAVWPLLVFSALGVNWLVQKNLFRLSRFKIIVVVAIVFSLASLKYDYLLITNPNMAPLPRNLRSGHLEEWTAGQGIREIAQYLSFQAEKTRIAVGTEGYFGTLPDGLMLYFDKNPRVTIFGVGQPIREIPQSVLDSSLTTPTYLVVNQSRFLVGESRFLDLVNKYPKAIGPKGQDFLLLYKVR